jgi:hypothetical protein
MCSLLVFAFFVWEAKTSQTHDESWERKAPNVQNDKYYCMQNLSKAFRSGANKLDTLRL